MARRLVFADEAGNFDFSSKGSRFFIVTTVTFFDDYSTGQELQELRRQLAWEGVDLDGEFHATTDKQAVRDRVYAVLKPHGFRVDATILEKRKAHPKIRRTDSEFYQYAWYYHMKHVVPLITVHSDDLLVVAASIGTKSRREAFYHAVRGVMAQIHRSGETKTACWPSAVEPCLQVADYCSWAIQRKWEKGDARSHALIADKLCSEYDLFRIGTKFYY